MENQSTFDLNPAVQHWRASLDQSSAFRRENLDELESHLRDSIAALQTRGLSAEEAFLIATKRIGRSGGLAVEFSKINRQAVWLDRVFWMLVGYQVWTVAAGLVNVLTNGTVLLGSAVFHITPYSYHMVIPTMFATTVRLLGLVGSLALCWWLFKSGSRYFGPRFARAIQTRFSLTLCFVAFCLMALLATAGPSAIDLLRFRVMPEWTAQAYMMSQYYSSTVIGVTRGLVLVALTLHLARRRLTLAR